MYFWGKASKFWPFLAVEQEAMLKYHAGQTELVKQV